VAAVAAFLPPKHLAACQASQALVHPPAFTPTHLRLPLPLQAHVIDPSSSWHTGGTVHGGAARSDYSTVAPTAAMAAVIPASGSPTRAASADYEHESADLEIATPAALLSAARKSACACWLHALGAAAAYGLCCAPGRSPTIACDGSMDAASRMHETGSWSSPPAIIE
jgi:hypothetical protein